VPKYKYVDPFLNTNPDDSCAPPKPPKQRKPRSAKFPKFLTALAGESFIIPAANTTPESLAVLCSTYGMARNLYFKRLAVASPDGMQWRIDAVARGPDGQLPACAYGTTQYARPASQGQARQRKHLSSEALEERKARMRAYVAGKLVAAYAREMTPIAALHQMVSIELPDVMNAVSHYKYGVHHKPVGVDAGVRYPLSRMTWILDAYNSGMNKNLTMDELIESVCAGACKKAGKDRSALRWKYVRLSPRAAGVQFTGPMFDESKSWFRNKLNKKARELALAVDREAFVDMFDKPVPNSQDTPPTP